MTVRTHLQHDTGMKSYFKRFVIGILFLSFSACSTEPAKTGSQESPSNIPSSGTETIAIVGTNDIHGTLAPLSLKTRETEGSKGISYEAGGAAVLASYIKILREEFGDHMIWLDGGDEFQGSIESNLEFGAPMVRFFNNTGLNAAAIGNHEFDFGLPVLESRMREAHYPYLAANISDKATGNLASFPNTLPHTLIQVGNLKVGIIGLSTQDTPTTTRAANVATLKFDDLKSATLLESIALRKQGAHIILITAHAGLKCEPGRVSAGRLMRKSSDPQGECGDQDEIVKVLRSLPTGIVDGVVSGHTHTLVHHWVANVPVIQGGAFGRYLNVIYLTYDWAQKKLLDDLTLIEGPVPVCRRVFQNQNDCNGDRPAPKKGRGPLVPLTFHGKTIKPDSKIDSLLQPILAKSEVEKQKILGMAVQPIDINHNGESALGNLMADAIRSAAGTDFAYVNRGGIRAPLEAGPITYGAVFRSSPFENSIATLRVTSKELEMILRVAESGSRGFGSVSGLRLRLINPAYHAPNNDLNGNGVSEPWETNRLLEITLPNGKPLDPNRYYTLATIDFLVTGGDDMGWPMSKIPADRIQMSSNLLARNALIQYIQKSGPLNDRDHLLMDPEHPRLKFEKPLPQKTKKKARKGGSRRKSK